MIEEVSAQLSDDYVEMSRSILLLSNEEVENTIPEYEEFKRSQKKRILDVQLKLAGLGNHASKVSSTITITSTRTVEMEKCKAPSFSGKTIEYPEFKCGWCKIAGSVWDDANKIEHMKYKVDDYTKKIISHCKDMDQVWDALDKEYGQEQEAVNAANKELTLLKLDTCSTAAYIVKLRNSLPGLEDALKSVDGLEHLHSTDKDNYFIEKFD